MIKRKHQVHKIAINRVISLKDKQYKNKTDHLPRTCTQGLQDTARPVLSQSFTDLQVVVMCQDMLQSTNRDREEDC